MSSYLDGRRAQAVDELFATGAELGQAWADRRDARKAAQKFQADYAAALQAAKQTGNIDPRFQRQAPEDVLAAQIGIKKALLRELAKVAPNHPLVKSAECRDAVAQVTLLKFNRANRPGGVQFEDFAPNDDENERIIEAFR